jgi:hypothetical protein
MPAKKTISTNAFFIGFKGDLPKEETETGKKPPESQTPHATLCLLSLNFWTLTALIETQ